MFSSISLNLLLSGAVNDYHGHEFTRKMVCGERWRWQLEGGSVELKVVVLVVWWCVVCGGADR